MRKSFFVVGLKALIPGLVVLIASMAWAKAQVECDVFMRQPSEHAAYRNIGTWTGLRGGNLEAQSLEGEDLGFSGAFSLVIPEKNLEISGTVRENTFETVQLSDGKTGASAVAFPFTEFALLQLVTDRGANLYEAQCRIQAD